MEWLERLSNLAVKECLKHPAKSGAILSKLENVDAVIVSDRTISSVHSQFLNEKGPTDVITFDHGEILIGVQTANTNAVRYRNRLDCEIGLYIIHGLLHLSGHTDLLPAEASKMKRLQESILKKCLLKLKEG